jgi:hypothetical protein
MDRALISGIIAHPNLSISFTCGHITRHNTSIPIEFRFYITEFRVLMPIDSVTSYPVRLYVTLVSGHQTPSKSDDNVIFQ